MTFVNLNLRESKMSIQSAKAIGVTEVKVKLKIEVPIHWIANIILAKLQFGNCATKSMTLLAALSNLSCKWPLLVLCCLYLFLLTYCDYFPKNVVKINNFYYWYWQSILTFRKYILGNKDLSAIYFNTTLNRKYIKSNWH